MSALPRKNLMKNRKETFFSEWKIVLPSFVKKTFQVALFWRSRWAEACFSLYIRTRTRTRPGRGTMKANKTDKVLTIGGNHSSALHCRYFSNCKHKFPLYSLKSIIFAQTPTFLSQILAIKCCKVNNKNSVIAILQRGAEFKYLKSTKLGVRSH